jgi:hypothetical protein
VRVHVRMDVPGKSAKELHKTKAHKSSTGEVKFDGESVRTQCAADTQFRLVVKDHSTFGSDDDLGEAPFFLSDQGSGGEQAVNVGKGRVVVQSSFQAADKASISGHSKLGGMRWGGAKREGRERSATPGS